MKREETAGSTKKGGNTMAETKTKSRAEVVAHFVELCNNKFYSEAASGIRAHKRSEALAISVAAKLSNPLNVAQLVTALRIN